MKRLKISPYCKCILELWIREIAKEYADYYENMTFGDGKNFPWYLQ
jgi:hypothetical protein